MGELHLEVIVDRMKREFSVEANVGRPQVSYRETVRGTAEKVEGRFVRQTGGSGQFGVVYINIEPAPGEGFDFVNKIKGGAIPTEFIPAVEKGVEEALENGVKAGYPTVDVRGHARGRQVPRRGLLARSPSRSPGSLALKEAAKRAKPVLLEPIFSVEVVTPEEFLGDVIGDLSRRRGRVEGQERRGNALAVTAKRAAQRDVRVRHGPALEHAGARDLHDAVRALRRGPAEHRRDDRRAAHRRARAGVTRGTLRASHRRPPSGRFCTV